jgi:polyhydroxyalkanoate synthase
MEPNIASNLSAPQHRPRPLPLFLELLRSETQDDPARMRAALAGLKAYQTAPRMPRADPPKVVARQGRATLSGYGGEGRTILLVPSLINGSEVLDLAPGNSLMRWFAANGMRPLLLDWGTPDPDERDLSVGGHVERYLLPLIDAAGPDIALAGYCLGGTMAIAAAALRRVAALILIAAPWDFAGFPSQAREGLAELWTQCEPGAEALGLLPVEVLQQAFWNLDPQRTVAKFEAFAGKDPASPAGANYVAVEDWANGGAPLTLAAGRELLRSFMTDNGSGNGDWQVGGRTIDPATIDCPILNIVSTVDRITPAATAWAGGDRIELALGHVGMVVGGRAEAQLWASIRDWLSQVRHS